MTDESPVHGLDVSRETLERLRVFEQLVLKWNPAINLVSKASLPNFWQRHVVDSMQLLDISGADVPRWCDLGSGGGFPGLVIACIAKGQGRKTQMTLVEADSRKCVFLHEAARQLDLDVTIKNQRIEEMLPAGANIVSARALAPLVKLCGFAARHIAAEGQCIFPKGSRHLEELQDARRVWRFDMVTHPSSTDPTGSVVVLRNLQHA